MHCVVRHYHKNEIFSGGFFLEFFFDVFDFSHKKNSRRPRTLLYYLLFFSPTLLLLHSFAALLTLPRLLSESPLTILPPVLFLSFFVFAFISVAFKRAWLPLIADSVFYFICRLCFSFNNSHLAFFKISTIIFHFFSIIFPNSSPSLIHFHFVMKHFVFLYFVLLTVHCAFTRIPHSILNFCANKERQAWLLKECLKSWLNFASIKRRRLERHTNKRKFNTATNLFWYRYRGIECTGFDFEIQFEHSIQYFH